MAYIREKYSKSNWKEGTTSGMEQRIESLEQDVEHGSKHTVENLTIDRGRIMVLENKMESINNAMAELQGYVAEQTPFVDEEQVPEPLFDNDRGDLIDALKVAHKGLKPGATATQNNIAYYAVRGILSQEED